MPLVGAGPSGGGGGGSDEVKLHGADASDRKGSESPVTAKTSPHAEGSTGSGAAGQPPAGGMPAAEAGHDDGEQGQAPSRDASGDDQASRRRGKKQVAGDAEIDDDLWIHLLPNGTARRRSLPGDKLGAGDNLLKCMMNVPEVQQSSSARQTLGAADGRHQ